MSNVTKWHRTDGGTVEDPLEVWLRRNFAKDAPQQKRKLASPVSISIEITLDPDAIQINATGMLRKLQNKLIIELYEAWQNKEAVARALGVSVRTVWTVIDAHKSQ